MKIVSLNAWGGAMFDDLAPWLASCDADVICLQEVTRTPDLTGWTRFTDGERDLPQRANLLDDIREILPHHHALFVASDAGPVLDESGHRHHQEFGTAVFVGEKLTTISHEWTFVHRAFVEHVEWPTGDRPRVAQAVRVEDRSTERSVAIVHLHGVRDPTGKCDNPAREAQAERLAEFVTKVQEPGDFVVVCGDFNVLPDSATFETLGALGLTDLVGTQDTRSSKYDKPVRHASYLLVSDTTAVRAFDIPPTPEVSDHRPLVLEL